MPSGCLVSVLFPLFAFIVFLKMFPGMAGEGLLHVLLRLRLGNKRFRILHDVMLPAPDGGTTQIDHIVLSPGGIFVIETKSWGNDALRGRGGCWIFGGERDREWTVSYPGAHRYRFQNPLRQNFKHIAVLSEGLGLPLDCFRSIVAFAGTARFQTDLPENAMGFRDVPGYIRAHATGGMFTPERLLDIEDEILGLQASLPWQRRADHVANLRRSHAGAVAASPLRTVSPDAPECPRCGSRMVWRTRKSDGAPFWGCPRFPECRGTRPA